MPTSKVFSLPNASVDPGERLESLARLVRQSGPLPDRARAEAEAFAGRLETIAADIHAPALLAMHAEEIA